MAKLLYRIGKWCVRRPLAVILIWVLLLGGAAALGTIFKGPISNEMSIPGTKGQDALDLLNKEFPQATGGTIRIIFAAGEGTLDEASNSQAIQKTLEELRKDQAVLNVADPFQSGTISPDKTIGYADVIYNVAATEVSEDSKEHVQEAIGISREAGVQTELGGDVQMSELEILGVSELIGIAFAFLVLIITFKSFLAAGLPLVTALVGVGIGMMLVYYSANFFSITSTGTILAVMLGIAVGIDYALFIISRHRQQMAEGVEAKESIARANATAGSAVIFAGLTVIIALAGLSIVNIPFLTVMGLAGAFTVLIAVIVAVTLLPSILGLAGAKLAPKAKKQASSPKSGKKPFAYQWAKFASRYPIPVVIVVVALLVIIALPARHMELGLPDNGAKPLDSTERKGYDLLSQGFGPGFNGPLVVVVKGSGSGDIAQEAAAEADKIKQLPNVAVVSPPIPNQTGDLALLSVIPLTGPNDKETKQLVHGIRGIDEKLMVTGTTALNIDISEKLNDAFPIFGAAIVVLAFILLTLVFRSLLVPIKAILGFVLSIISTLGAVVFIFQDGHLADVFDVSNPGVILCFLPILLTGVLFGLAMDYEVFLVSRMREEFTHKGHAKNAIVDGMGLSGRVVTAAGLIMIFVFGSFIFVDDPMIKVMGFSLTAGVLIDAFLVRMTLVPAIMALLGRSAWYLPKWLGRILPNVDIEGDSIRKELEQA
ncbi:MMPL family transporter [Cohnella thailandensis]|uniref:MMPL family transporter n=1 Tax=Cohnella thailandensis TaxID=557557 RepID=A0A841STZ0_9BACL|nr:MMPL family transporter [Cohnella thailandensis]MBB6634479.1 MMPL family transporter [Cohnella thailandensis]MBP1972967.1 membrane protein YdfJ [Cohnella thailandensis]